MAQSQDQRILWTFDNDRSEIYAVSLSEHGDYIAAASQNLMLFDKTGKNLWIFSSERFFNDADISKNGKYIAGASIPKAYLIDRSGKIIWEYYYPGGFRSVAFLQDNITVMAETNDFMILTINKYGKVVDTKQREGEFGKIGQYSSSGAYIVKYNNGVRYYAKNGTLLWDYNQPLMVFGSAISDDGKFVAFSHVQLYFLDAEKEIIEEKKNLSFPAPHAGEIRPNSGEAGSKLANVLLTGENFQESVFITLQGTGNLSVNSTNISVISPELISCDLDLQDASEAIMDIYVVNTDGQFDVISHGFYIDPSPEMEIISVSPDKVSVTTSGIPIEITGAGFRKGATVILNKTGVPSILARDVIVQSPDKISCSIDAEGMMEGVRNLVVINPDGSTSVLPDSFTLRSDSFFLDIFSFFDPVLDFFKPVHQKSIQQKTTSGNNLTGSHDKVREIIMKDLKFDPSNLTIRKGTTVTWYNQMHFLITLFNDKPSEENMRSLPLPTNYSYQYTFTKPGTYVVRIQDYPTVSCRIVVTE